MTIRHTIDEKHALVLTEFRGEFTDDDLRAHLNELRTNPAFHRAMRELIDLRGVTKVSVSAAMMSASAHWLLHAPEARRALVARERHRNNGH